MVTVDNCRQQHIQSRYALDVLGAKCRAGYITIDIDKRHGYGSKAWSGATASTNDHT